MSSLRRSVLLAALLALLAAVPATSSSTLAEFGTYAGHDSHGNSITFEYAYDSVVNFHRNGSYFISQATLNGTSASFDKTEGNHTVHGEWTGAKTVQGTITYLVTRRTNTGTVFDRVTRNWTASRTGGSGGLIIPYVGSYSGSDQAGRAVRFRFDGTDVRDLTLNGTAILRQGYAGGGSMSTSQNGIHVTAHWETDHHVTGTITDSQGRSVTWSANAFST